MGSRYGKKAYVNGLLIALNVLFFPVSGDHRFLGGRVFHVYKGRDVCTCSPGGR